MKPELELSSTDTHADVRRKVDEYLDAAIAEIERNNEIAMRKDDWDDGPSDEAVAQMREAKEKMRWQLYSEGYDLISRSRARH